MIFSEKTVLSAELYAKVLTVPLTVQQMNICKRIALGE